LYYISSINKLIANPGQITWCHQQIFKVRPLQKITGLTVRHLGVSVQETLTSSETVMLTSPISNLIDRDYDIPSYSETGYDTLLHTQAHKHGAMLCKTEDVDDTDAARVDRSASISSLKANGTMS
jgi:hypothetical protein